MLPMVAPRGAGRRRLQGLAAQRTEPQHRAAVARASRQAQISLEEPGSSTDLRPEHVAPLQPLRAPSTAQQLHLAFGGYLQAEHA